MYKNIDTNVNLSNSNSLCQSISSHKQSIDSKLSGMFDYIDKFISLLCTFVMTNGDES